MDTQEQINYKILYITKDGFNETITFGPDEMELISFSTNYLKDTDGGTMEQRDLYDRATESAEAGSGLATVKEMLEDVGFDTEVKEVE